MPRFTITPVAATRDVHAIRAHCDGCDAPRPVEEHSRSNRLWLLTEGCFELRDAEARRALDPATIFVFPAGHAFTIRHPSGADTCLSFRGPVVDAIAARGAGARTPGAGDHARLLAEVAAWRRGHGDELALAEALVGAAAPEPRAPSSGRASSSVPASSGRAGSPPTRRERELADELGFRLRLHVTEPVSLAELADAAGVSMFHACRVFRRVTGAGMHQLRSELRLRHALALLLDSSAPLAEVAAAAGYASQSHLTNRFRDRFGVTPARARATPSTAIRAVATRLRA